MRAGILLLALLLLMSAVAITPEHALAQVTSTETPFAGPQLFSLTCTCSGNVLIVLWDYYSMMPLALVYQPGMSVLYSYFNIWGQYYLGSYQKNSGSCKMIAPNSCPEITSNGMMGSMPGTGTSL